MLQRLLGGDAPPNKVQEIRSEVLGSLPVLQRDEGLVLYGPAIGAVDRKPVYEIVLNRPYSENLNSAFR